MSRTRPLEIMAYDVSPPVTAARSGYEAEYGTEPADRGGWYHDDDWRRISLVLDSMAPGSLLDVGAGAGQFVNAAAQDGRFTDIHAIDVGRFNKFFDQTGQITYEIMPATLMSFDDASFDNVTCLEVLEHVPDDAVPRIVGELTRVCAGRLVVTVPYREAKPWSDGHLRSFTRQDLQRLFPAGEITILSRRGSRWAMLEIGNVTADPAATAKRARAAQAYRPIRSLGRRILRRIRGLGASRRRSAPAT